MRRVIELAFAVVVALGLILLITLVARAHTAEEQEAWHQAWNERVAANGGLTTELVNEWLDWDERHRTHTVTLAPQSRSFIPAVENWRTVVELYFGANTDRALSVMQCESRGDAHAKNPRSTASGLFQFLRGTWKNVTGESNHNGVFDGRYNIEAASILSKGGTDWSHWVCKPW